MASMDMSIDMILGLHSESNRIEVHSTVSYYSHSYNYLVVAVVVAEAQNMHF